MATVQNCSATYTLRMLAAQDVQNLGVSGQCLTVKHGFARNALLPSGLGVALAKGQPYAGPALTAAATGTAVGLGGILNQITSSPVVMVSRCFTELTSG